MFVNNHLRSPCFIPYTTRIIIPEFDKKHENGATKHKQK